MALVSLYVPDNVPKDFLNLADGQLVTLVFAAPTDDAAAASFALFDRITHPSGGGCACGTRNGLAVRHRTLFVQKNKPLLGFSLYALPPDCTFDETVVVVTWLTRFRFKRFRSVVERGWFYRTLESESFFRVSDYGECCRMFALEEDPVFMLKSIVLSPFGKGPTLESVLKKQSP